MKTEPPVASRALPEISLFCDLAVIGGGMAGVCCAITAARAGLKIVLIQDRPVLGGNASSEVRLWLLGATSHMGNNNRWAREGGVVGEIMVENLWRNPDGNPLIFDTVVLEKVIEEPSITLLLNTAVFEIEKSGADRIAAVRAFCSQNSTMYDVSAPLFCDASGDGIVGFLAGAAFRMGAESREEFGEGFAPTAEYGELLGHSIYFYSKDAGRPVKYVPPSFALSDITKIPRFRSFNAHDFGCKLWWLEYGGRLDTVHETETIKWELWKVVYGVWNHIKNSGNFPEAETLTLEWVGHIPGKRESRRFEGDYMLRQQDIIEQRTHADAVSFGGWSIDLHPADGVFSERPGSSHQHSRGIYQIPYRTLYSRNIGNLFLAGRVTSSSHVAFGSTRVMATCALSAHAAGMAAAICLEQNLLPAEVCEPARMRRLQRDLIRGGQHIPGVRLEDSDDLAQTAVVSASSAFAIASLPPDGPAVPLDHRFAQLLPVSAGPMPLIELLLDVSGQTTVEVQLRTSNRPDNYTPDVILAAISKEMPPGEGRPLALDFAVEIDQPRYVFLCLMRNPAVKVRCTNLRATGLLTVANRHNARSGGYHIQVPAPDAGVETFEFWCPPRRPEGHNFALKLKPAIECFRPESVLNGFARPTSQPNAWVADPSDPAPALTLRWSQPQNIARIELSFDTDFDHAMESVLMLQPERAVPFCVQGYSIFDAAGRELARVENNHQTRNTVRLPAATQTGAITIRVHETHGAPASIFEVRCYS